LRATLHDKHADVRDAAIEALQKMDAELPEVVCSLVVAMQHGEPAARMAAIRRLGEMGPRAEAAVPALSAALRDTECIHYRGDTSFVRAAAARALEQIGPPARAAVPALVALLADEEREVRSAAAAALGGIGPEAVAALAPLTKMVLHSPDWCDRMAALAGLGGIGPVTVGVLMRVLGDPDGLVRARAAWWLAQHGPKAGAGVDALLEALTDEDSSVGVAAAEALWRIRRHPAVLPALVAALEDPDSWARSRAAEALGRMGADAEAAVPALVLALREEEGRAAADALRQLGPAAAAGVPALAAMLTEEVEFLRWNAAWALGGIGPAAQL
jgi:HEAT repeat protein